MRSLAGSKGRPRHDANVKAGPLPSLLWPAPAGFLCIGRFIFWLNLVTGSSLDLYHIIGFEVGGHLGGLVGRSLNGLVPFITALNPPRTGWNETNMFRPSDGLATEAIHTDVFGSGMLEPVADCDFYPNGGLVMPGCYWVDWECSRDSASVGPALSPAGAVAVAGTVPPTGIDTGAVEKRSPSAGSEPANEKTANGNDDDDDEDDNGNDDIDDVAGDGFTSVKCESTTDALEGNCDSEETIVMGGLVDKSGMRVEMDDKCQGRRRPMVQGGQVDMENEKSMNGEWMKNLEALNATQRLLQHAHCAPPLCSRDYPTKLTPAHNYPRLPPF
ncbi:hypothetical protein MSG28_016033 [Choristoneura fumiferana]|uniref:Uncharacterized protein n=1 Tax=Choristoneura fumiferana TaxID=7141 RepID=A0ACC0K577_CHOFU|nr:hypothetical protein MSG28_016033 [Choristoneura fumiferana]